jgi:hypothetical protein
MMVKIYKSEIVILAGFLASENTSAGPGIYQDFACLKIVFSYYSTAVLEPLCSN